MTLKIELFYNYFLHLNLLFAVGIILYELYAHKYIFDSSNQKEIIFNKEEGKIVKETIMKRLINKSEN